MPETQRTHVLERYDICGSQPEPALDRLAGLAARLIGTPISVVSFFDESDRWVIARRGTDTVKAPREDAFCNVVVNSGAPLLVGDLTSDARFRDDPHVTRGGLRAYAGVPIASPGGDVLGTIAVVDVEPREFGPQDRESLEILAAIAGDALELRLRSGELEVELALRKAAEEEAHRARQRYDHLAHHDSLTGLPNRLGLQRYIRRASASHWLLLIDLDGFKAVNDAHGHAGGDQVLREISRRLALGMDGHGFAARLGGDEFAVLLGGSAACGTVEDVAIHLLDVLAEPICDGRDLYRVTASLGISRLRPGEGPETGLERADRALYTVKARGRFGCAFADDIALA
ncbi:sensor domain-containing diguanylate cyclase [Aurantimonas sp. VKM B-3413]|uniref:sensor domain-containing diguanylate cyclase n=1 Tax=Aurantimonas sp. VKM B-3413 TaxID=2779401 RepID=UPI001E37C4CB|nr:sensor domain-containing diguanylate cyclase [Aurantimonas sp. VKM B-3413]MCB8839139.1 sensor domain-containing diguanylate cyclase [Aurantimonas sp. VKM B-3413]